MKQSNHPNKTWWDVACSITPTKFDGHSLSELTSNEQWLEVTWGFNDTLPSREEQFMLALFLHWEETMELE